ncbi:hypothetical protein ACFORL_03000 [Legionella dresdenensis]|uniref:Alpha/beta hydrolase family protein n=1 Tax=Legionella dresdenensis TaxID=450200 RepID=A0ABV8CDM0_9GAMM
MKNKRFLIILMLITHSVFAQLYPHERIMHAAGAESLVYFQSADKTKPMIIFIPGDGHLARIFYGYPQGNPADFLNYWIHKKGYPFLALSYPSDNQVFNRIYPAFTISQWGEQIAAIAKKIIDENKLTNKIIIAGWSMGGAVEQTVSQAAQKQGLEIELFIGLSAVPPLPYVMQSGAFDVNTKRINNLADRSKLFPLCFEMLTEQSKDNGHAIVSYDIYRSQFTGNIPAALAAEGYWFKQGQIRKNIPLVIEDSGIFDFATTPWIALIVDDSPTTAKISLIDPYAWSFLRAEMINKNYLQKIEPSKLAPAQWQQLRTLVNNLPDYLKITVHGNHFFFVGEKGAKATADAIETLSGRVRAVKQQLEKL